MSTQEYEPAVACAAAELAFPSTPRTVVYADRVPRGPGEVEFGTQTIRFETEVVVLFRDEQPGANWMHACSYAAVDPVTWAVVQRSPADRPPVFGLLPDSWIVASDPDNLADLVGTT